MEHGFACGAGRFFNWGRRGLAFKCIGAIGAVVARFVHTEEVTGSNPVSPTAEARFRSSAAETGLFHVQRLPPGAFVGPL